jgi:hypothetical protein
MQEILNLEHADRHRFIEQISAINRQMNVSAEPSEGIPLERLLGM